MNDPPVFVGMQFAEGSFLATTVLQNEVGCLFIWFGFSRCYFSSLFLRSAFLQIFA
jgi:hypothetical protein